MKEFTENWNRVIKALYPDTPRDGQLLDPKDLAIRAEALVRQRDALKKIVDDLRDKGVI